jgi:hypothetical protein
MSFCALCKFTMMFLHRVMPSCKRFTMCQPLMRGRLPSCFRLRVKFPLPATRCSFRHNIGGISTRLTQLHLRFPDANPESRQRRALFVETQQAAETELATNHMEKKWCSQSYSELCRYRTEGVQGMTATNAVQVRDLTRLDSNPPSLRRSKALSSHSSAVPSLKATPLLPPRKTACEGDEGGAYAGGT